MADWESVLQTCLKTVIIVVSGAKMSHFTFKQFMCTFAFELVLNIPKGFAHKERTMLFLTDMINMMYLPETPVILWPRKYLFKRLE